MTNWLRHVHYVFCCKFADFFSRMVKYAMKERICGSAKQQKHSLFYRKDLHFISIYCVLVQTSVLLIGASCAAGDIWASEYLRYRGFPQCDYPSWMFWLSRVVTKFRITWSSVLCPLWRSRTFSIVWTWLITKTKTFQPMNEKNTNSLMASDNFIRIEGRIWRQRGTQLGISM